MYSGSESVVALAADAGLAAGGDDCALDRPGLARPEASRASTSASLISMEFVLRVGKP
jgi:hypothetical protein